MAFVFEYYRHCAGGFSIASCWLTCFALQGPWDKKYLHGGHTVIGSAAHRRTSPLPKPRLWPRKVAWNAVTWNAVAIQAVLLKRAHAEAWAGLLKMLPSYLVSVVRAAFTFCGCVAGVDVCCARERSLALLCQSPSLEPTSFVLPPCLGALGGQRASLWAVRRVLGRGCCTEPQSISRCPKALLPLSSSSEGSLARKLREEALSMEYSNSHAASGAPF